MLARYLLKNRTKPDISGHAATAESDENILTAGQNRTKPDICSKSRNCREGEAPAEPRPCAGTQPGTSAPAVLASGDTSARATITRKPGQNRTKSDICHISFLSRPLRAFASLLPPRSARAHTLQKPDKTGHARPLWPLRPLCSWTALVLIAGALCLSAHAQDATLVIRGARVVDGTGNPAFFADVAIRSGRIVAVGQVPEKGADEIDGKGLVLAPGFIDVHTHSENVAFRPGAENFLRMGVTSIVTGNCGSSARDVGEFFRDIEERGVALNVATLFGHNTARSAAMGGSFDREPSPEELARMRELTEKAMNDGAVGLSTGLIYLPGTFSKTEEIIELAKVASPHDGIYASHMRSESTGIFDALNELIRVAREAHIRAHVSHIKLAGNSVWGKSPDVLATIERARDEGLDITQDQYVYTASSTGLSTLIPSSAREGGAAAFRKRLEDPAEKAKIVAQMKESLRRSGRDSYAYAVIARFTPDRSLNGKNIAEAARLKRGADTLDDQIELILDLERQGGGGGIFHGMSEDDLQRFLRHPNTMFASDGGVQVQDDSVPHPRSYGNNARVLARYVRELRLLRLEDAVRRMTSLPAHAFRLRDRGVIREGAWADLVLFDPAQVQDVAAFGDPHHFARGFTHVLVNGIPVIRDGQLTGKRPGQALRHNRRATIPGS